MPLNGTSKLVPLNIEMGWPSARGYGQYKGRCRGRDIDNGGRHCAVPLDSAVSGFDRRYPDPLPRISTMLRWIVATDGNSASENSRRASCHAS